MLEDDTARPELAALIREQAEILDFSETDIDALWLKLLETEEALVPEGLHVLCEELSDHQCQS